MRFHKLKNILLVIPGIVFVYLISLAGCGGNPGGTFTTPEFEEPGPPPIEVTIDQLYAEYMTDEAAADAKYKGKRLLFTGVTVEEVGTLVAHNLNFLYNMYIMSDSVRFEPRYLSDLDVVREGFVVDIVGELRGLVPYVITGEPFVVVSDCWINIVEGEVIEGWYPEY